MRRSLLERDYYIEFVNIFLPHQSMLFPIPEELYNHLMVAFNDRRLINEYVCYSENAVFFKLGDDGEGYRCMLTSSSLKDIYKAGWQEFATMKQQAAKQGWEIVKVHDSNEPITLIRRH